MNRYDNLQARKIAKNEGFKETQSGKLKDKKGHVIGFSETGKSGTHNGSVFTTVHELNVKLSKNK